MVRIRLVTTLALVALASFSLVACGQDTATTTDSSAEPTTQTTGASTTESTGDATTVTSSGENVFTVDELAQFDGANGSPAYVAVDGVVYDITGSRMWPDGTHGRCDLGASAGRDLSELINKAPANMRSLLAKMPVVGKLGQ